MFLLFINQFLRIIIIKSNIEKKNKNKVQHPTKFLTFLSFIIKKNGEDIVFWIYICIYSETHTILHPYRVGFSYEEFREGFILSHCFYFIHIDCILSPMTHNIFNSNFTFHSVFSPYMEINQYSIRNALNLWEWGHPTHPIYIPSTHLFNEMSSNSPFSFSTPRK